MTRMKKDEQYDLTMDLQLFAKSEEDEEVEDAEDVEEHEDEEKEEKPKKKKKKKVKKTDMSETIAVAKEKGLALVAFVQGLFNKGVNQACTLLIAFAICQFAVGLALDGLLKLLLGLAILGVQVVGLKTIAENLENHEDSDEEDDENSEE